MNFDTKLISRIRYPLWAALFLCSLNPFIAVDAVPSSVVERRCDPSAQLFQAQRAIAQILNRPHLARTRWGLDIRQMSEEGVNPRSIYAKNSAQLFLPASTAKLFTSVALVSEFDAAYQLKTPYIMLGKSPVLRELKVVGVGDPSILDPELLTLAQDLKAQGVTTIERLVGDGHAFGTPAIVPSWEWVDLQTSDGVPITSLSFSQNSLPLRLSPTEIDQPLRLEWLDGQVNPPLILDNQSLTVGPEAPEYIALERSLMGDRLTIRGQLREGASPDVSYVAIANPTAYFLHRLKSVLERQGITVENLVVQNTPMPLAGLPPALKSSSVDPQSLSGAIASPPLSELLKEVNQSSNNFYTESLLRHWAWVKHNAATPNAPVNLNQSLETLEKALEPLGIDPDAYRLKDASGLSRQNLVSPESLTSVVTAIVKWQQTDPAKFTLLKDSLAIASEAGTLKRRFQNTSVSGKLFAKTGTLSGTVTLAGFLQEPGQPTIALSIMANHSDQSITTLRRAVDDMVLELHRAQSCDQNSPA